MKSRTIHVRGTEVTIATRHEQDYIALTDMVKNFDGGSALIERWLKNKDTVLFLGVWEQINNPVFNSLEFEGIKNEAGRYGGTYAHKDIAFEFGSWLSPEFKLYLIKEFQRLKDDENRRLSLAWNLNRTLSKLNYRIHTDAIKAHIIPAAVTPAQAAVVYASEADLLNVALFGRTAKQWRDANPKLEGNMREYATVEQLLVLANIEGMNAEFIHMGLPQSDRLKRLNEIAIRQMKALTASPMVLKLKKQAPPQAKE